ncbi:MAG: YihY family inner membrane protein [Xanthomonadales bacterium]
MNAETEPGFDLQATGIRIQRLANHVWKHFREDRCLEEAASLSYTSLLAMVPLLAVIFGVVAAFPVFGQVSDKLQSFIFANFIPAAGDQIEPYLNTFLESVSSLTLPGTVFLIITALLLMFRIEVAFNRIWRVNRARTLINRIVMYWSVLTLGPILTGAAIALSAQKVLTTLGIEEGLAPGWNHLGIFFLSWMVFTMFFVLVPNRRVQFRDAVVGAFLSTVLFDLAKLGFVAYVSNANYSVIYGALATIPIFLFWLYIVWAVILFGASLAASLTTFSDRIGAAGDWPDKWTFQLSYRLVGHLWSAQRKGESLARKELMELEERASEHQILQLMQHLQAARIVTRNHEGRWILARDLEDVTLGALYHCGNYYLPLAEEEELPVDYPWDRSFVAALATVHEKGEAVLNRSLRDMYVEHKEPGYQEEHET